MSPPGDGLLSRLVGLRLNQVVFVMDYLQLCFDGTNDSPVLTYLVWPTVTVGGLSYHEPEAGYAQALRTLITRSVVATSEAKGGGVVLRLSEGASLTTNPLRSELVGPEIAMLQGFLDQEWMVWRPGEGTFSDLL